MIFPFFNNKKAKKTRELRAIAAVFSIMNRFAASNLIHWQTKQKILLIEEELAKAQLELGAECVKQFLDNVAAWQNFQLLSEAYEAERIRVETEAVRAAQKKYVSLTKADLQRIRMNARNNMQQKDPEQLPLIKEFDIFIIRASAPSADFATVENGQLLAIGHYDGNKVEMAMYDDIKHNLQQD